MSYSKLLLSISTVVVMASYPAQAGFKWDTGVSMTSGVDISVTQKQPVDDVIMNELSPVQQVAALVEVHVPEPEIVPVPVEITEMDVIEGFGRDVPLSYAVVSVIPASYAYSFGADVNPAQPITWKGGKPWDKVLEDAISSNNLFVRIDGNKVVIHKQQQVVTEVAPTPALQVLPVEPQINEVKSSEREVFVRRGSGNVVAVERQQPTSIESPAEEVAPVNIIETTNLIVEEEPVLPVMDEMEASEEVKIIEKINPDMPAEVTSYTGNDDNVFEVVVSQQTPSRVLDAKKISSFHAKSGQTVRGVIEKWSDEADVQVYWETKYDFPVEKSMALTATYPMAVQALLGRYEGMEPRPTVKLHPNWPHGPSIITIK